MRQPRRWFFIGAVLAWAALAACLVATQARLERADRRCRALESQLRRLEALLESVTHGRGGEP